MGNNQSKKKSELESLLEKSEEINKDYILSDIERNKIYLKDYIELLLLINKIKQIINGYYIAYYNTLDILEFLPTTCETSKKKEILREAIYQRVIRMENFEYLNDSICLARQLMNKIDYDDEYIKYIMSLGTFYKIKIFDLTQSNSNMTI